MDQHLDQKAMEPLGAVASLIAIGQALAALPRIVNMLRSMADVKGELATLMNEVLFLYPEEPVMYELLTVF